MAYYQKMPWLAVPMDTAGHYVQALGARYGLRGLPHLVLLDGATGQLVTADARTKVVKDPYGLQFPWTGPSLSRLLLPASLRQLVSQQLRALGAAGRQLVRGALEGWLPRPLLKLLFR